MYQNALLCYKNILNDWASSITLPKQSKDVQICSDFAIVCIYQHHREYSKLEDINLLSAQSLYSNNISVSTNISGTFQEQYKKKGNENNVRFRK